MVLPTVHIRKEAFLIMTWAAIETFKKECLGFLLGHRPTETKNHFFITDAIPWQSVKRRSNTEVEQARRSARRFGDFISDVDYMKPKHLGDFHSHPEWGDLKPGTNLSKTDIRDIIRRELDIEILICISSRQKGRIMWEAIPDGSVKGSLGQFDLHILAYTLLTEEGEKEKKPYLLQIVTPSALRSLNRTG